MEKKSVFIIDNSKESSNELLKALSLEQDLQIVGVENNGIIALEKIKKCSKIDVLILDLILPGLDGYQILSEISENKNKYPQIKVIIAQASLINDNCFAQLRKYNVANLLIKPYNVNSLINQININLKFIDEKEEDENQKIEFRITKLLHKIGIPSHIKGFTYLRTAICSTYYNPEYIGQITKQLYPEIAKKYKSSSSKVERAIRHAIELAWERGDVEVISTLFGNSIPTYKDKPSNSEFIALISDYLALKDNKISSKV